MFNIVMYFKQSYHNSKYHMYVNWQTMSIYIEPKYDTKIKSITVKISIPFIDYEINTSDGNSKKVTSFGVLTPLDIIGEI